MRKPGYCGALLAAWLASTAAADAAPADAAPEIELHIDAPAALQEALLTLAEERLRAWDLRVDRQHAWLSLSGPLPRDAVVRIRPAWSPGAIPPASPLMFELAFRTPGASPVRAALAVRLLRAVRVAARPLRKGARVGAADLELRLRDLRRVPARALGALDAIPPGAVALRDLGPGDALRETDLGPAPEVIAGAPVRASTEVGGVSVSITATALADARVGDRVDVRLPRSTRVLQARVTGSGTVLVGARP